MDLKTADSYRSYPCEILYLTAGSGENKRVPFRSGLNWGQRPGRNQNQAYLSVSVDIQRSRFFPDKGIDFTVMTDDDHSFRLVRAQENGKALHSLPSNDLLGVYFRSRLNVESGDMVVLDDLLIYGRTTVDFFKVSADHFFMDFSSGDGS